MVHCCIKRTVLFFSLNYGPNPALHYLYPTPNAAILTNIAHSLACVPKFYVQVRAIQRCQLSWILQESRYLSTVYQYLSHNLMGLGAKLTESSISPLVT